MSVAESNPEHGGPTPDSGRPAPDTTDWEKIRDLALSGVKEWKYCFCHPENKIPSEWDCCWVCQGPQGPKECHFRQPAEQRFQEMRADQRYERAVRRVLAGMAAGYYELG